MTLADIQKVLLTNGQYRVVFLGDSITSAEHVHPNWREIIEYVLKKELAAVIPQWKITYWGIRCFNAGFDGASTIDLIDRIPKEVVRHEPDLVIFMASSNDAHFSLDPERHASLSRLALEQLEKKTPQVIACTSVATPHEEYTAAYGQYADAFRSLFPRAKTILVDVYAEFLKLDRERLFTFRNAFGNETLGIAAGERDYAHPDHRGNAALAKIILSQGFGVSFDPEKFLAETRQGDIMYPGY